MTKNGSGRCIVSWPTVTSRSCMAWSRAACVLGGVRLISSARMMLAKIGPGTNRNDRRPASGSSRTLVPVMSEGIRSGVNWMRLKPTSRIFAIELTRRVLASPGTPTKSAWPRVKMAARISSTTSRWPITTLLSSATNTSREWRNSSRSWVIRSPERDMRCASLVMEAVGPVRLAFRRRERAWDQRRSTAVSTLRARPSAGCFPDHCRAFRPNDSSARTGIGRLPSPDSEPCEPNLTPAPDLPNWEGWVKLMVVIAHLLQDRTPSGELPVEPGGQGGLFAMFRIIRLPMVLAVLTVMLVALLAPPLSAEVTREEVERAIRDGVRFVRSQQRKDGSWPDYDANESHTGVTSLVTLALLTAGESPNSEHMTRAIIYLRQFGPADLNNTYTVALQTMVFAAADPARNQVPIGRNAKWLELAQIKVGDRFDFPGSWTYSASKNFQGDSSNSQYALLGLNAAAEAGIPIDPKVWVAARDYWEKNQRFDGSWPYRPGDHSRATASMTCAGISSLIITGMK